MIDNSSKTLSANKKRASFSLQRMEAITKKEKKDTSFQKELRIVALQRRRELH